MAKMRGKNVRNAPRTRKALPPRQSASHAGFVLPQTMSMILFPPTMTSQTGLLSGLLQVLKRRASLA